MVQRRVRPPRGIQGSEERDHAAWERQVQQKVGDSNLSLGDVEHLLFLDRNYSHKTNELQSQIDTLKISVGLIKKQSAEIEELKRRLDEQEKTTWLLPLN
jgi:hypothetical protein